MTKKICAIGVDVDTLKDYVSVYGYDDEDIPCENHIYTRALPRVLDLFDAFNIKATFFVIGRDILNSRNLPILKDMIKKGHEIGNHTMNHIYPFSVLPPSKKKEEITLMQKAAEDNLGYRVKGFRAPGYGIDGETLQILEDEGYVYDSSIHPTYFLSLMNMSVIVISSFQKKLPELKSCLHCFAPLNPYTPKKGLFFRRGNGMKIVEVPITVTPFFRMPFYGTFHLLFGKKIFDIGYSSLQKNGTDINYEMHAIEMLDLIECNLDKWFNRQPGINVPLAKKQEKYRHIMNSFKQHFDFRPILNLAKGEQVS